MNIQVYAVEVELYADYDPNDCLCTIKNFDKESYEIKFKTLINSDNWEILARRVGEALKVMEEGFHFDD